MGEKTTTLSVSQFRERIRDIGGRVAYAGERIAIKNYNKPYFAVVSYADLELLQYLEDKIDLEFAVNALKTGEFVPWQQAGKEFGS